MNKVKALNVCKAKGTGERLVLDDIETFSDTGCTYVMSARLEGDMGDIKFAYAAGNEGTSRATVFGKIYPVCLTQRRRSK